MDDLKSLQRETEKQEERLRFKSFDDNDAWKLGNILYNKRERENIDICFAIYLFDRCLFMYNPCKLNNERWLAGKYLTVKEFSHSSQWVQYKLAISERTPDSFFMPSERYAVKGGGFPIYVEGTGVVGAVVVSGLSPEQDHAAAAGAVEEFLKK